jgi:hypothetical protein
MRSTINKHRLNLAQRSRNAGECQLDWLNRWWYRLKRWSASRPGSQRRAKRNTLKIKSSWRDPNALRTETVRAPVKRYRYR